MSQIASALFVRANCGHYWVIITYQETKSQKTELRSYWQGLFTLNDRRTWRQVTGMNKSQSATWLQMTRMGDTGENGLGRAWMRPSSHHPQNCLPYLCGLLFPDSVGRSLEWSPRQWLRVTAWLGCGCQGTCWNSKADWWKELFSWLSSIR